MTAPVFDDTTYVYWLDTVASLAAPTVANITAGTLLPGVTNFDTPSSEAEVDTSDIYSIYDTSIVGTSKAGPITLTIKRDDTDESDTWDLLEFRDTGVLVFSDFGPAVATSKVRVYPVQVGQRRPAGYGRNTVQTFDVSFYVTSDPELDAVVAA
jgi:hypothetical protein